MSCANKIRAIYFCPNCVSFFARKHSFFFLGGGRGVKFQCVVEGVCTRWVWLGGEVESSSNFSSPKRMLLVTLTSNLRIYCELKIEKCLRIAWKLKNVSEHRGTKKRLCHGCFPVDAACEMIIRTPFCCTVGYIRATASRDNDEIWIRLLKRFFNTERIY